MLACVRVWYTRPKRCKWIFETFLFKLQNIINKVINHEKKTLYCAFIDFKKAFDFVNRNAIWFKLSNDDTGSDNASLASSKMVHMLKSMYNITKMCVKSNPTNNNCQITSTVILVSNKEKFCLPCCLFYLLMICLLTFREQMLMLLHWMNYKYIYCFLLMTQSPSHIQLQDCRHCKTSYMIIVNARTSLLMLNSWLSPFLGRHGFFGYILFFIFMIKTRTFLWVGILRKLNTCRRKKIKVTRSKKSENKYRHCVMATWTIQWILVPRTPRLHTVYLNRKQLRVQEKINKSMYHNQLW